jgi:polyisoprenoid-binding protein YceI
MMARKSAIYLIATALVLSSFTLVLFQNWTITPGYSIKFDGKYAHGSFDKLSGTINFDPLNLDNSKFDVVVDVASINTGIDLKNKHAKSDKWFDAEKYPVIHFVSSSVAKSDTGFVVRGELELHGVRKGIEIPFAFRSDEGRSAFYGKFKVNRGDFAIGKTNGKDSDSTAVEVYVPVNAEP